MSTIARHSGAPFLDGEVVDAGTSVVPDEVELDLQAIFNAINGNLDDDNVAAGADIQGSKIAINTLTDAKGSTDMVDSEELETGSIGADQIADGAVQLEHITAGAVSNQQLIYNNAFVSPVVDQWTEIHSGSVLTGPSPNAVLVLFCANVRRGESNDSWLASDPKKFRWRLKRNGTVIATSDLISIWKARHWVAGDNVGYDSTHFPFLDTNVSSESSVLYSIETKDENSGEPEDWYFWQKRLVLWNLRR